MNFWAFWSTNSGGVGGFVAQETKNLKKCDLDLNKLGVGYIKGGVFMTNVTVYHLAVQLS